MSERMTDDDKFEISRRKVLAGLGTIGVASLGAGYGTSAYFSDREDLPNNNLVAGSLDLVLDWEEHYSDWSDDEVTYMYEEEGTGETVQGEINYTMTEPEDPSSYMGFPFSVPCRIARQR
ncbi:MAG: SipW-dependent-type signal peptide-containing protein [Halobacteria archaeon]|nr:SipW-dependent-type signal peptide-containing protein [Halobacteria archaeon]